MAADADPKDTNTSVQLDVAPLGAGLEDEVAASEAMGTWEFTDDGDVVLGSVPDVAELVLEEEPPALEEEQPVVVEEQPSGADEPRAVVNETPVATAPAQDPPTTDSSATMSQPTDTSLAHESEASKRRAAMIARLGAYTPKVEAWRDPESAEEAAQVMNPARVAPTATPPDLPIAAQTAAAPEPIGEPLQTPEPSVESPVVPLPDRAREVLPPAPAPIPSERPLAPVGEPVFRPMMEQTLPDVPSRETQSEPIDVPGTPQVPLPLHVEFGDRQSSYTPSRIETLGARPLPGSHPFARAGQTEAMTALPVPSQRVPTLEPIEAESPPQRSVTSPFTEPPVSVPASEQPVEPPQAEEQKGPRWRRGKVKTQKQETTESPGVTTTEHEESGDVGWSLDDVLGPGGGTK
jgi:hypothetical protein